MLLDGFALTRANCTEYFRSAGHTQQNLIFAGHLIATLGTLATGIIALAHASKDATAIVALATTTTYSVMDDISKDFLFSADNIESVRDLTLRTMQADQTTSLANTQFTYDNVVIDLQEDQNYCLLSKIAALVKDAAKNAAVEPTPSGAGTPPQPAPAPNGRLPLLAAPLPVSAPIVHYTPIRVKPLQ
jgi:hypothetical protein